MTGIIEIEVSIEEIAAREERVTKTKRFETADRVPVIPAINYRYLLPAILSLSFFHPASGRATRSPMYT